MDDEQPLDDPPQGPSYKIHQTPNSGEMLQLLLELRNDLLTVNFNGQTIRDPSTQLDYTNILEFVVALVDISGYPPPDRSLDGFLLTSMHIMTLLNNVERHESNRSKNNRIQALLRNGGAPTGAAALQWTAMEKLLDIINKHNYRWVWNQWNPLKSI